jgi:hypothetical protein
MMALLANPISLLPIILSWRKCVHIGWETDQHHPMSIDSIFLCRYRDGLDGRGDGVRFPAMPGDVLLSTVFSPGSGPTQRILGIVYAKIKA